MTSDGERSKNKSYTTIDREPKCQPLCRRAVDDHMRSWYKKALNEMGKRIHGWMEIIGIIENFHRNAVRRTNLIDFWKLDLEMIQISINLKLKWEKNVLKVFSWEHGERNRYANESIDFRFDMIKKFLQTGFMRQHGPTYGKNQSMVSGSSWS